MFISEPRKVSGQIHTIDCQNVRYLILCQLYDERLAFKYILCKQKQQIAQLDERMIVFLVSGFIEQ